MNITSEYLLEGAALALEQCGRLLSDAVTLFDTGSFSTALVLAAFAREELGKCRAYQNFEQQLSDGAAVTLVDLKAVGVDHVKKQEDAMLSVMTSGIPGTQVGDALQTLLRTHSWSEEYKQAKEIADLATKCKARRIPTDRHQQRMMSLYVDPTEVGWSSPKDVSRETAIEFVTHAVNDYAAVKRNHLEHQDSYKKLHAYLNNNKERIVLPEPRWPTFL